MGSPRKRTKAASAKPATATLINWPGRPFHVSQLADDKLRFARTQQEAGIGHLDWDSRLRPLRPWCKDLMAGLCLLIFAAACIFIATAGQP